MRRFLRTTTMATAALAAAVVLYVALSVPPRSITLDGTVPATVAMGGYHVHSIRSDGTGTVDEIASAARKAGLSFLIFTDHGDGTRTPDPPVYRDGVLCIDALEINTWAGHVVALGLTEASPYPLAGHPRDVIEDVHRMGGVAIVAHPDSPNADLRWRGQNVAFDGIEWLNGDSEWRDETPRRLFATAARSLIRAPEALASLFERPVRSLDRLDAAVRRRPVFGLAALDAHANLAWRDAEEPRRQPLLAWPAYEAMFRTVAQSVVLDAPLTGRALEDAAQLLAAITAGRSFSIVQAFAGPAALEFSAHHANGVVRMGGRLEEPGVLTTFRAAVPQAPGASLALLVDGKSVATGQGSVERSGPASPGVYRVEVSLPGAAAPWIISNPITVALPNQTDVGFGEASPDAFVVPAAVDLWTVEREPTSSATVTAEERGLRFAFRLAPGVARGQYAALATPIGTPSGIDRVRFTGRSSRPMRVSLQVRLPGGGDGQRWRRSVYLDTTPRLVSVSLQEFEPVEPYTSQRPIVAPVRTLLFVVDTLNSATGTDGVIWISDVSLGMRQP